MRHDLLVAISGGAGVGPLTIARLIVPWALDCQAKLTDFASAWARSKREQIARIEDVTGRILGVFVRQKAQKTVPKRTLEQTGILRNPL
jgi:hypothetical protein